MAKIPIKPMVIINPKISPILPICIRKISKKNDLKINFIYKALLEWSNILLKK